MKIGTVLTHGFAQPERISNGMATIRAGILERDPDAHVICGGWKDDPEEVAEQIAKLGGAVNAASHSYGGWWQATRLFPALHRRGIIVDNASFADPVGRHPLSSPLYLGPNVSNVRLWKKQRNGIIRTSELILTPHTRLVSEATVKAWHGAVDDDEKFIAVVVALAKGAA